MGASLCATVIAFGAQAAVHSTIVPSQMGQTLMQGLGSNPQSSIHAVSSPMGLTRQDAAPLFRCPETEPKQASKTTALRKRDRLCPISGKIVCMVMC
jgi:hypothetical protein